MTHQIVNSDALTHLMMMDDESVHMVVTSPPYFGLRDYKVPGQIGLEKTPEEYVGKMVEIFREVRRVLRSDGTFWLNIGDSYAGNNGNAHTPIEKMSAKQVSVRGSCAVEMNRKAEGCKPKDMIGIPWLLAFALRSDGWYLRADLPWIKRNSMPSSVTDRPASSIEHVFLLSKSKKYYYDHIATMQPAATNENRPNGISRTRVLEYEGKLNIHPDAPEQFKKQDNTGNNTYTGFNERYRHTPANPLRFMRDSDFFFRTWQGLLHNEDGEPMALVVNPRGYKGAHFACVDTETECLTISGWKRYDQLQIGMEIFTYNMKTGNLELQPLQGIVSYRYTGNLVSVSGRSSNMLMTPNHRCVVTTRDKKVTGGRHPAKIVEAANLKGGMKFPVAAPLSFKPYGSFYRKEFYELMGWVLSEGYFKDTGSIGLTQSLSANPEKCKRIDWLLKELDIPHRVSTRTRKYKEKLSIEREWYINGWARAKIRQTIPDKYRIPENFLLLPDECIDAFLEGFIGGDGHVRPDERITISQKEKQPLDIIQAMLLRRGRSCVLSQRGNGHWSAFVTNAKDRCFKDSKGSKVDMEYPYDGLVWCPTVQNGTWVARRGGRPFITGNCFPVQLVEPMILVGTSEKGVCPVCGAPWKRIINKIFVPQPDVIDPGKLAKGSNKGLDESNGWNETPRGTTAVETVSWQPTCSCNNPNSIPATVLDPFSGSSATGVACKWHNRNYIGIELNPEYCKLAEQRISEGK